MKSLTQINDLLTSFETKFGYALKGADQGSEAWYKSKLGVLSASRASEVVSKRDSATRLTYMSELIGQICTGVSEEITSKHMDWGMQNEDAARACYEMSTGLSMTRLPFVFKDESYREGCSPDGLVTLTKGAEIKCPWATENYIKFLTEDTIKPEWRWQCQYTMRILGADQWDFVMYDPRMQLKPMKIIQVERDEDMQKKFEDLVPVFIEDMDNLLAKIGIRFGDQWHRLGKKNGPESRPCSPGPFTES